MLPGRWADPVVAHILLRQAGIALAREVERRAPDAVTTSWWKEERGQRIVINFN